MVECKSRKAKVRERGRQKDAKKIQRGTLPSRPMPDTDACRRVHAHTHTHTSGFTVKQTISRVAI